MVKKKPHTSDTKSLKWFVRSRLCGKKGVSMNDNVYDCDLCGICR